MGRRLVATVGVAALVLGSACGDDAAQEGPAVDATTTTGASSAASSEVDELVDVGGGRQLHLRCEGDGSPTVLLEAGDDSGVEDWARVMPAIAEATRTCAYDRFGTGTSSPAEGCRQLDDLLDPLDDLLEAAGVPGPYVFVGASGGGNLAVAMAERHADELAGIVLADTPPAIPPELAAEIAEEIACDAPGNVERRDIAAIEHAVWDDRHLIADVPVRILSDDSEPGNAAAQEGWLVLSPRASQIVVQSGHDIPIDEPEVVIDAIRDVLALARDGG